MFFNGFENPKLAAIRLLRSQGCCPQTRVEEVEEPINGELEGLLRYKEELESRVAQQRSKMSDIPCAIEIGQEIEELQEIIEGLARENKQRARELQIISKEVTTTSSTEIEDDEEDARENERLQGEYKNLMRRLEKINDRNTMLVNKLIGL